MVEYITGLRVEDVPWKRLISSYGWAERFPKLLSDVASQDEEAAAKALSTLCDEIEHQDTLWPCTPFALVFLYKRFVQTTSQPERSQIVISGVLEIFDTIADACRYAFSAEHADALPGFSDMLSEKYLLPGGLQDNDDVYLCIEDGFDIPDELFYSIYYYSHEVLRLSVPFCTQAGAPELAKKILLLGEMIG